MCDSKQPLDGAGSTPARAMAVRDPYIAERYAARDQLLDGLTQMADAMHQPRGPFMARQIESRQ